MKYAAIADWADEKQYSVTFMCDQLGVTRQGYYRWRSAGPCARERTDAELTEAILAIHTELDGHPGARRIWAELITRGQRVSCGCRTGHLRHATWAYSCINPPSRSRRRR